MKFDHSLIHGVIQGRRLKLYGIDPQNLTDSVLEKLDEMSKQIEQLKKENKGLRTRKITRQDLVKLSVKHNFFTHKKKKLILALSSCRPISKSILRHKSKCKNLKSLEMLISATRKHIELTPEIKGAFYIKTIRSSKAYQLVINPDHFIVRIV